MLLSRATPSRTLLARMVVRGFAASSSPPPPPPPVGSKTLTGEGGVHGNMRSSGTWRNKPLFRREGDARFKTGAEAAAMLSSEAIRRDGHEPDYVRTVSGSLERLATVFDRSPKYAWIAKQLLEPERAVQFRVAWIDDGGIQRLNRGFRIQYSSALGPYEGSLHFGRHINLSKLKGFGFNSVIRHGLTGFNSGAAVGGADFNPHDKSESEIQRFCQAFMTELAKYIGPDVDLPYMGQGVSVTEIGYLYGQYKRIAVRAASSGIPFLWGGQPSFPEAAGFGIVHFADEMLREKGETLKGKRCLITGSNPNALAVAEKLLEYGAIPLSFTDSSGHIYEPDGFDAGKLATVRKVKSERGARVGRYIIASTTALYSDPEYLFNAPCDLCFPCSSRSGEIDAKAVKALSEAGCKAVIEGGEAGVSPEGRSALKKMGMPYAPSVMTLCGPQLVGGIERSQSTRATDDQLKAEIARVFRGVKQTATEFNVRGDMYAGAVTMGFLKVANTMVTHGAV